MFLAFALGGFISLTFMDCKSYGLKDEYQGHNTDDSTGCCVADVPARQSAFLLRVLVIFLIFCLFCAGVFLPSSRKTHPFQNLHPHLSHCLSLL